MSFNNIIEVVFDIGEKKYIFRDLDNDNVLKYFVDNYSTFLEKEIFRVNSGILHNEPQANAESLGISKILFETKELLTEKNFFEFLKSCNFNENDSKFIKDNLNNELQGKSIIGLLKELIHTQSFSILKEYRESPQARKDIKNKINNQNISSSILNPFLILLGEKNSPSLRMELWQKFEMYFESGWGFNDLTKNDSNSILAEKMKTLISQINSSNETITSSTGLGKELLTTLSERITELGVPVYIKMEINPINGANIPIASIIKDKQKYQHAFNSKKTMPSGFVDWAIPKFNHPDFLYCSLATADETCNIENSEAFRYEYALRELSKNNNEGIKHISLSFYTTSTFYDEFDLDENNGYNYHKPHKEIGQVFLSRFKVYKEQRKLLNTVPFFAMSHKISSNIKTGIYSPSQLMSYNFKILGAKSMMAEFNDGIEEIYKRCINVILNVFSQDSSSDYYSDGKTLNMLNQLYNLITTSKDEFFESKKIFNLLTNDETINSLNSILKKIPENQNNEKQVNKNDFKTLIQSLKYIKNIGLSEFKTEQIKQREDFLEDLQKLKHLTSLSKSILYIKGLVESIENDTLQLFKLSNIKEFIEKSPKEQKDIAHQELVKIFSTYYSDKRTRHEDFFLKNTTVLDYPKYKYLSERSYPTFRAHYSLFSEIQKEKDHFLYKWKTNQLEMNSDNMLKMCFHFTKNITEFNFNQFELPKEWNTTEYNKLIEYSKPENIEKFKSDYEFFISSITNRREEKEVILKSIKENYTNEEIKFVLNKLDLPQLYDSVIKLKI